MMTPLPRRATSRRLTPDRSSLPSNRFCLSKPRIDVPVPGLMLCGRAASPRRAAVRDATVKAILRTDWRLSCCRSEPRPNAWPVLAMLEPGAGTEGGLIGEVAHRVATRRRPSRTRARCSLALASLPFGPSRVALAGFCSDGFGLLRHCRNGRLHYCRRRRVDAHRRIAEHGPRWRPVRGDTDVVDQLRLHEPIKRSAEAEPDGDVQSKRDRDRAGQT